MKDAGLAVGTVIDIRVQRDGPELRLMFPDKRYILFEPVREYAADIKLNYEDMSFDLENNALSDRDDIMFLKDVRSDDDGIVSHVVRLR
ncbi:hypothetical protein GCM10007890_19070 [Methylobacterium tardum]|uniref:Uncharacterized protein n=1 Tax=Methylobacterium tardum TaxID=374432 RepID=A0AA37WRD1_9HYPH|nr:hypothetical protein GCM10007890_19070 [Methylobacterium tardum]